jgi:hypothetical protein
MKKAMVAMMFLAGGLFAGPRFGVGISIGAPAAVVRPVCPGSGYTWVDGYNTPNGGYWAPPAAVRVAPRYDRDVRRIDRDHHIDRNDHRGEQFRR